jgi:hypothetical protein
MKKEVERELETQYNARQEDIYQFIKFSIGVKYAENRTST